MAQFPFADGPCLGQTYFSIEVPPVGQVVPCGGHYYVFGDDFRYHDVGTTDPRASPTAQLGTHGPRGWADLQRAVDTSLPTGLHRAKLLRAAARGKLQQRRRMG